MSTESTTTSQPAPAAESNEVSPTPAPRTVRPEWHSRDNEEGVTLLVALPGTTREDLELTVRENQVALRAPRSFPEPQDLVYELTFRLSRDLDPESASAQLRDGLLSLQFARREEAKPRRISVEG